jgi:hypothetical protein
MSIFVVPADVTIDDTGVDLRISIHPGLTHNPLPRPFIERLCRQGILRGSGEGLWGTEGIAAWWKMPSAPVTM